MSAVITLDGLEKEWIHRKKWLEEKIAFFKGYCTDESFAAIEALRRGPSGTLLDVLVEEARLAELNSRLEEFSGRMKELRDFRDH